MGLAKAMRKAPGAVAGTLPADGVCGQSRVSLGGLAGAGLAPGARDRVDPSGGRSRCHPTGGQRGEQLPEPGSAEAAKCQGEELEGTESQQQGTGWAEPWGGPLTWGRTAACGVAPAAWDGTGGGTFSAKEPRSEHLVSPIATVLQGSEVRSP